MLNFRLGSKVSDMIQFRASENQILQPDPYKDSDTVMTNQGGLDDTSRQVLCIKAYTQSPTEPYP